MTIAHNIDLVMNNIASACARSGRDPDHVTLLAVSKTQLVGSILEAANAGVQHFGENRVEEAVDKIPKVNEQLATAVTWHMIGHIQSRKARDIPPLFQVVHSVDTLKLAHRLSNLMVDRDETLDVLLEMNISGEVSKSGFGATGWTTDPSVRETLWQLVDEIVGLPGLRVRGLMTMAPIVADMEEARPIFAHLANLRDVLAESLSVDLPELSMGMTDDYPVAVEEGATIVRVGRAIFGSRQV
jgi:hypothetical protein